LGAAPADSKSAVNPLVRVLQAKGILTAEEVAQLGQASSASDADQRLAKLLLVKGVISQADYDQTVGTPGMMRVSMRERAVRLHRCCLPAYPIMPGVPTVWS